MANNDQYLFENMAKMYYNANGIKKTAGLKVIAGKTLYPRVNYGWSVHDVSFGSFFSVGCMPVVSCTLQTRGSHAYYYTTTRGIQGGDNIDHRGFRFYVMADRPSLLISGAGYAHWIAVGW